ncbi:MAG: pseudouridine synthase [Micavibrio sp.]|nr:pseudouridine synthase [Micavibrio sp.]
MSDIRIITVQTDDEGQRVDRWIKRNAPDLPYVLVQKLLRKGQIRVDGKRAKPDTKLSAGQDVRLPPYSGERLQEKRKITADEAAFMRSLVIYDDGDVLAINKPEGWAVQGGTNTQQHIDGLLEALSNKDGVKPRLVHRLDKDTSGVLLLARSAKVARELGFAFKGRDVKKTYWALVSPVPEIYDGTIKAPLMKAGGANKERMRIDDEDGKQAITEYKVVEVAGSEVAFVAFWPRTGRTHQIRVHAEYMGCPILGDGKYNHRDIDHEHEKIDLGGLNLARRLHLHAHRLVLPHPSQPNKTLDISAPLPPELAKSWKKLGFDANLKQDPFEQMKT